MRSVEVDFCFAGTSILTAAKQVKVRIDENIPARSRKEIEDDSVGL